AMGARYAVSCVYADYAALLDGGNVDAVVISAPAATHADITVAALEAGVHVFVEKPLCITLADADRIIAARDRAARVVQVGYMKRFDPAWERMLAELPTAANELRYVRGMLERLGERLPARVVAAAWWNEGRAITGTVQLANGARWDSAWIQLLDIREYQEQVGLYFRDSLRRLTFPSPWLRQAPTRYERSEADELDRAVRSFESHRESFVQELVHFHECITAGAEC